MSHHNSASDRDEDDDAFVDGDLFREPEGFRPPEKQPTFAEHTLLSGQKVKLRLVGHNPLWVLTTNTFFSATVTTAST